MPDITAPQWWILFLASCGICIIVWVMWQSYVKDKASARRDEMEREVAELKAKDQL